ncbi:hypothetical protein [Acinetobacter bereziniae]|uniref:hypothetical protein n=1 Tax=Acinetobacter bereziniae TaxID=106648 RepID=UPI001D0E08E9|nr:hypothetical protein [Acinetobacter bereziniae]
MKSKIKKHVFGYDVFKENIPFSKLEENDVLLTPYDEFKRNHNWSFLSMNDDFPAIDWDGIHYLDQRKTAIVNIFKLTINVNEWKNIIERINAEGDKITGGQKNLERHIINFLASGLNLVRFQIDNIVLALNNNTKYTGPTNKWIKDFIEARTSLEGIKTWPLPQIAYNQDDSIFKQVKLMQGYDENNEILYLASANDKPLFSEYDNDTYLT